MPTYEFKCTACGKKFSHNMTMGERAKFRPQCPKCKSRKVEQIIAAFFANTAKKS